MRLFYIYGETIQLTFTDITIPYNPQRALAYFSDGVFLPVLVLLLSVEAREVFGEVTD